MGLFINKLFYKTKTPPYKKMGRLRKPIKFFGMLYNVLPLRLRDMRSYVVNVFKAIRVAVKVLTQDAVIKGINIKVFQLCIILCKNLVKLVPIGFKDWKVLRIEIHLNSIVPNAIAEINKTCFLIVLDKLNLVAAKSDRLFHYCALLL